VNFRPAVSRMMQNELTTALLNILPVWSPIKEYNSLSFFIPIMEFVSDVIPEMFGWLALS
jgi:hypothetical protein